MNSILITALLTPPFSAPSISDLVPKGLEDASFTVHIVKGVRSELAKINHDFMLSYEFTESQVKFQEPFRLRLDSSTDDQGKMTLVVNGGRKVIRVPRSGLNLKQDVSKAPGKRQTMFDFGVLTPSMFQNFLVGKFVREDRATHDMVFDLTYASGLNDTSRYRVWIDPEQKFTSKREWYAQDGHLMATFLYEKPTKVGGYWFPTRLTVKNAENRVAGVSDYSGLKINTGLSDSLFKID